MSEQQTPASVSWETGRLDIFRRRSDGQMYHKYFDNGWGPGGINGNWEAIGSRPGGQFSSRPAAVSWQVGRLDIFAVGGGLAYHKYFDNGWGPGGINGNWEAIGGVPAVQLVDSPAAVSWQAGRLDAFAHGSDGQMYHKYFDNGWGPGGINGNWEAIGGIAGGQLVDSPAAVSWQAGRLDAFARGSDGRMYHKYFDNGWGPGGINGNWEAIGGIAGGQLVDSPAAVSWQAGRLDAFARGSDGRMYHKYFDNGWGPGGINGNWEAIGGIAGGQFTSAPAAVSWQAGRLDAFARGSDGRMYHKYFDNGWGPGGINGNWEAIGGIAGGQFTSAPAAVSWQAGRLDAFARGSDGRMYHKYFDNGWGPGGINGNWETIGA